MRTDKQLIIHCLGVMRDGLIGECGDRSFFEIHADGSVRLVTEDLVRHDTKMSIDQLVNRLSPNSDKSMDSEVDAIYNEYPRKRDVGAARVAIRRALMDAEIPTNDRIRFLKIATWLYAKHVKEKKVEQHLIPYCATWFNRKSYLNAKETVLRLMLKPRSASSASPATAPTKP